MGEYKTPLGLYTFKSKREAKRWAHGRPVRRVKRGYRVLVGPKYTIRRRKRRDGSYYAVYHRVIAKGRPVRKVKGGYKIGKGRKRRGR